MKYPKKSIKDLPEGFEYSNEAKENLKQRSDIAGRLLKQRTRRDVKLKKRVNDLFKMAGEEL